MSKVYAPYTFNNEGNREFNDVTSNGSQTDHVATVMKLKTLKIYPE